MPEETNKVEDKTNLLEYAKQLKDQEPFYDEMIPHLEKVLKYESLKADISEARFKDLLMQAKITQIAVGSQQTSNSQPQTN